MLYRIAPALFLALSACTVAAALPQNASLSTTAVAETCTGFAGIAVPNCDFSRPPAY